MAKQALYLRWRPSEFDEVVGQEHVTYTLRNALAGGRLGHAYLFSGPRGTGKTTMARLLAKSVNCLAEDAARRPCNECAHCLAVNQGRFLDLIEIDAASHTGVDDVRELRDRIAFAPNEGRYKVYIIDEVHRFSGAAFDALLKTIEEPPAHAIFVLATTEIHKVPQTILSRCQRFDFRRIPLTLIVERLRAITDSEGIAAEDAALELIARQGTGSMRDCISLLDQLLIPGEVLTLDYAQAILGTASSQIVQDLTWAIVAGDSGAGLGLITTAMDSGADPRQLGEQMVEHLRRLMLHQTGGDSLLEGVVSAHELSVIREQSSRLARRVLLASLRAFSEAYNERRGAGWNPQLPLEMALVDSIEALEAPAPAAASAAPVASAPAPSKAPARPTPSASPARTPAPAAAPAAAGGVSPDLETLQARWDEFLKTVRGRNFGAEALLKSGILGNVEGSNVIMLMKSAVLVEKLESNQFRLPVEEALRQVFGVPLRIVARLQGSGGASEGLADAAASDSLARFAMEDLGGTVSQIEEHED